jgi:hypothetical protein
MFSGISRRNMGRARDEAVEFEVDRLEHLAAANARRLCVKAAPAWPWLIVASSCCA